ncbi:MAG: hypothetical protein LUC20_01730 [Oscillospiraceae bacterium]|nr:hypothetical protein [Oscillospiraceae bacterium]
MAKKHPCDIYEAAILLDGLLDIIGEKASRSNVITKTSRDLRQMATNRGIEIDDTYRNVSGIDMQIKSMESAFYRKTISLPSTKVFDEVVDLYNNNYIEYKKLLGGSEGNDFRRQFN